MLKHSVQVIACKYRLLQTGPQVLIYEKFLICNINLGSYIKLSKYSVDMTEAPLRNLPVFFFTTPLEDRLRGVLKKLSEGELCTDLL